MQNPLVLVRRATPRDAHRMADVDVRSWRAAYADLMPAEHLAGLSAEPNGRVWASDIEKHGEHGRKRFLVAEDDGEVVGYALAGIPTGSVVGLLYLLYVLPECWGSGAGQRLHDSVIEEFADLGATVASLWVLRENGRARRFYERNHWVMTDDRAEIDYGGTKLEAVCYQIFVPA